jgi:hypothetical protein
MFVLGSARAGQKARITVIRDGKKLELETTYGTPTMH